MTATRPRRRRNLLEQFQPFAADGKLGAEKARDVASRPGQVRYETLGDRIGDLDKHDRHGVGRLLHGNQVRRGANQDHVGHQTDQLRGEGPRRIGTAGVPAHFEPDCAPFNPAQFAQSAGKRRHIRSVVRLVAAAFISTPMRRILPDCARADSGQRGRADARPAMNSRRRMDRPASPARLASRAGPGGAISPAHIFL